MPGVIANNIIKKLQRINTTVYDFERKAGLKRSAVANIVSGKSKNPTIEVVKQIAKQLNCSIEELLNQNEVAAIHDEGKITNTSNLKLCKEVALAVYKHADASNYSLSIDNFFNCCKEACNYSIETGANNVDLRFISWITKKYINSKHNR